MDIAEGIKRLAKAKNTTIEAIVNAGGMTRGAFNTLKRRNLAMRCDSLYLIAQKYSVPMEVIIDEIGGEKLILDWAEKNGARWKPPPRLKKILDDLMIVDDTCLEVIKATVAKAAEIEKERSELMAAEPKANYGK